MIPENIGTCWPFNTA